MSGTARKALLWAALLLPVAVALGFAATSPLLQWRAPVYIAGGLAGVVAMALMLFQPLLAAGLLPGLPRARGRRLHRVTGVAVVLATLAHVGALWITSPPDVIDALTFTSPTPFAVWGVVAMWALFAAALLAALRRTLPLRRFRLGHSALALIVVGGTILHAIQIQGTMESLSKALLAALLIAALAASLYALGLWRRR